MIFRSEDNIPAFEVIVFRLERRCSSYLDVGLISVHLSIVADLFAVVLILSGVCGEHGLDKYSAQSLPHIGVGVGLRIGLRMKCGGGGLSAAVRGVDSQDAGAG